MAMLLNKTKSVLSIRSAVQRLKDDLRDTKLGRVLRVIRHRRRLSPAEAEQIALHAREAIAREAWSDAENLLRDARQRFPRDLALDMAFANLALKRGDWEEGVIRWQAIEKMYGASAPPRAREVAFADESRKSWPEERRCNVCQCPLFSNRSKRGRAVCMSCGSLERTRLLHLYLEKARLPSPGMAVLHIAPERGIYRYISSIVPEERYWVRDLDPGRYTFAKGIQKIDLCNDVERLPSRHFDLIVHNHVLEHVPCNYVYVLHHLHRALKDDGLHIFSVPVMAGYYDESLAKLDPKEAVRRFGQDDHVRRFGRLDLKNSLGKVVRIPKFDATTDFTPEKLTACNIPKDYWTGRPRIIRLRKQDYLLSPA